jgi:GNAT superfamily N-acetyltransferase
VWFDGPVALLDELYVVPGRRNEGLGSAVLREVEAEVRRRGGEVMEINVDGEDVDARRFYERHGYSTDRAVDQHEPAVIYYRELT